MSCQRAFPELVRTAVAHCRLRLVAQSVGFVADQSDDHAVEVEEEHQEVEAQLDEGFLGDNHGSVLRDLARKPKKTNLLVHVQLAENFGRVQQVLVLVNPVNPMDQISHALRVLWEL